MTEKTEIQKPSIQERVAKRVQQIAQPIELWLNRLVAKPEKFNPENHVKCISKIYYEIMF